MITEVRRGTAPRPQQRRPARRAWILLGSIFAVAALAWGTYNVVGRVAYARESTHEVFDGGAIAAVTRVDVRNGAGSTTIVGTDRDEIVVDASVKRGLWKPSNDVTIEGDTLVVRASCSPFADAWCNVSYTISVPARLAVHASGSGGGLRIDNVDGPIDASSSGGGLRIVGGSGDMRLRSSGGGVRAEDLRSAVVDAGSSGGGVRLSFVEPPQHVRATSSGGGVTVELPSPYVFNVNARSSGGGVNTSGVRHDPLGDRVVDVSSSGGGVTVRYREG